MSPYRKGKRDWERLLLTGKYKKETHVIKSTGTVTTCESDNLKGVLDMMQKLQNCANSALLIVAVSDSPESCVYKLLAHRTRRTKTTLLILTSFILQSVGSLKLSPTQCVKYKDMYT